MSGCGYEIKELVSNQTPLPVVERGYSRHMYFCPKTDRFIYTNGKTVVLRSFAKPEDGTVFTQHKFNATVAAFSPNGEWVASGDASGQVFVWGVKNGNIKLEAPISSMPIADVCWDSEGKRLCAVGDGSGAYGRFFSWDTGNACGTVEGHIKRAIACAIKPTRPFRAVTAGEDNQIVAYEGPPYKKHHILKTHERYPNKVTFHPSGDHLLSVGSDTKIIVYEGKDLTETRQISDEKEGHTGSIYSACFNGDGSKFVTCGVDKTVKIWNFEGGNVEATYKIGEEVEDQQMCVIWHKDWIVSISCSGALNYCDPNSPGTITKRVVGHMGALKGLSTDPKNKKFYSVDAESKLCVWENGLATWFKGKGHTKGLTDVAINCDGSQVVSVGLDDCLRFNDCKSMEFAASGVPVGGAPSCVCAGSQDPNLAVVGIGQEKIAVVSSGKATITATTYKPLCVALSPDDKKLLVGGDDKIIHLYSLNAGELKEEHVIKTHQHHVLSVRWSPCGKFYSSTSADKTCLIFDATSHAQLNNSSWEFHKMMVNDHAWSPDGKRVATISNDLNIFIWSDTVKFGTTKTKLTAVHSVSANKIGWLDDNTLVSMGADNVIKTFTV